MRLMPILIALCSLAVLMGTQARAQGPEAGDSAGTRRVVFVCEHGSVKSLVAMEYFNRGAKARGLPYRAVARGAAPEPTVRRVVEDGLRSDGFDVSAFVSRKFCGSDVDHASLIVSFDQDVSSVVSARARYLKWNDLPGILSDYTRGKDAIVRHVDALLDELAHDRSP
jgi:arsenate reductase (thioredoxin)